MKEKIIKLYKEGKSYRDIQKIVGCSLGTIAYHCGVGQKEKVRERIQSYKKTLNGILKRKKDNFSFANGRRIGPRKRVKLLFSSKAFKEKLQSNTVCYLTGRKIDLLSPKTYNCDHIIPVCKGGSCELSNMGLTCKEANVAKAGLTVGEFLNLCKEVLIFNGFKVEKV
jgi:hypothetical protein